MYLTSYFFVCAVGGIFPLIQYQHAVTKQLNFVAEKNENINKLQLKELLCEFFKHCGGNHTLVAAQLWK